MLFLMVFGGQGRHPYDLSPVADSRLHHPGINASCRIVERDPSVNLQGMVPDDVFPQEKNEIGRGAMLILQNNGFHPGRHGFPTRFNMVQGPVDEAGTAVNVEIDCSLQKLIDSIHFNLSCSIVMSIGFSLQRRL